MSKAKTKEEVREEFLDHIRGLVEYWSNVKDDSYECKDRLSGLAFSILVAIDGGSMALPTFDLVVRPHPDDKQYHIDNDEDWYEDVMVINDDAYLHELFYKKEDKQ